jgi:hypothetical protein
MRADGVRMTEGDALMCRGGATWRGRGLRLLVAAKDEALRDLRARAGAIEARLDASGAERRQLSERLTAVLTDRREQKPSTATVEQLPGEPNLLIESTSSAAPSAASGLAIARPPWWRRWFR